MQEERTILLFSDCHVSKDTYQHPLWDRLGKYIILTKPDDIICLGDFSNVDSLNPYQRVGTIEEDVHYTASALSDIFTNVKLYNNKRRQLKMRQYSPQMIMCLGNHEAWDKENKYFKGLYKAFNFKVFSYRTAIMKNGIYFSHVYDKGRSGDVVAATGTTKSMLKTTHCSCVAGHSHVREFFEEGKLDGEKILSIVAGTFSPDTFKPDWAAQTVNQWWRGLVMLRLGEDFIDAEFISTKQLTNEVKKYGKKINNALGRTV